MDDNGRACVFRQSLANIMQSRKRKLFFLIVLLQTMLCSCAIRYSVNQASFVQYISGYLINRNILLSLVQKLFIVHISGATCQREMQLQFCEGDSHTLSCAHFSKNINILSANYGRLTGAQVCGWGPIKSTHCKADGALAKVQAHCQGRSHCTLRATNSEFGDPCDETYKYLEVTIFLSQTFSQLGFKGISFLQFLIVARIRSFGKFIDLEKEVVA